MNELNSNELKPKVVLGVAAHPDDLDFGASGALARWASEGAEVYYLILTDGSKGSDDPKMTSEMLIKIRQEEQINALKAIGGKEAFFLANPDAYLEVTMDLKKDICRVIRKVKPDVVLTTDPTVMFDSERGFINHSDHRAAGQATIDAVFPMARDRLTFPELIDEGLQPHKVATLLLSSFGEGNFFVDITATIDNKMAALAAHTSQMADIKSTQEMMKNLAKLTGGKMGVSYGEGFTRINVQ